MVWSLSCALLRLQIQYERENGALTPMDIFPPQNEVTGPNGEYGLLKSAGYATNLILTSYDRFFNKQIWTPLLGGDVFQIQMTRPSGEAKAQRRREHHADVGLSVAW